MTKVITITNCSMCPYTNEHEDFCTEVEKVICNLYIIPDWCPLPDKEIDVDKAIRENATMLHLLRQTHVNLLYNTSYEGQRLYKLIDRFFKERDGNNNGY